MQRTPLYEAHKAAGARFVEFGGWEMPVQYTGVLDEHAAVRGDAGLFDVSHMGEIEFRGPKALAAVQELTVNDVTRLADGQAQYSLLCRPSGGVVDDVLVFRLHAERFLVCVNASNIAKDYEWMCAHGGGAEIIDRSPEFGLLAVQGPKATAIVSALSQAELAGLPGFAFVDTEVAGVRCLASRTGYTGEDGWELYCPAAGAAALWAALLDVGRPQGLQPAGLGARDTLRLERGLPLYGHELDDDTTPLEARLGWVVRFAKPSFLGRDALARQREQGVGRQLVGIEMIDRGIARQGYPIVDGETAVGTITSGTMSPTLGKAIAMGYVAAHRAEPGTLLSVEIRGRRLAARVVPLPFYKR